MIPRRLFLVSLILISISNLYAQIPRTLSYQAVLTDNAGIPKPDGAYTVTFRLYTAVSGGVALWTESQSLQVKRGLFSAVLGSVTPFGANLTFYQPYWLSLQVAPDAEMSPRLPLTSTAYSLAPWTSIGSNVSYNGGNVGIGITAPTSRLEIIGQDALLVVGYQPFITLSDANSGYKRTRLQNANGDLFIENEDNVVQGTISMVIKNGTGYVGIGTPNPTARLEVIGRTKTGTLEITAGSDLAERFDTETDDVVEPGSIMVIDAMNAGKLKVSELPYDAKVAGIVSGAAGVKPGITLQQDGVLEGKSLVAIAGRVYCKADAHAGPIEPGDLLTTSSTPGHAMKATDKNRSHGAIIGKAMSSLKKGTGLVLVLVNLQ